MKIKQPKLEALEPLEFIKGIKQTCRLSDLQKGVRIYIPRHDDYAIVRAKIYKATKYSRHCCSVEAISEKFSDVSLVYVLKVQEATRCYIAKTN